jgi:hypothetical protein
MTNAFELIRVHSKTLSPEDNGTYSCSISFEVAFENEVHTLVIVDLPSESDAARLGNLITKKLEGGKP